MTSTPRILLLCCIPAFISSTVLADDKAELELETVKGDHVTFNFRPGDWKELKDKKEFTAFYDDVYETMEELTGNSPPMILRGYKDLGAWGTAGMDGVNIEWAVIPTFMKEFNAGKVEFGLVHEIGHVFDARDFPRWYITPSSGGEAFANIKLSYSVDRLLREDTRYRIEFGPGGPQTGFNFNNNFYLGTGKAFVEGTDPWTKMSVDQLHSFHLQMIRKFGWDVYKKWFRAYILIDAKEEDRAPASTDDPLRMHVLCALLSRFSGENLVPYFDTWRIPVTSENIADVTKRYKLDRVCDQVDQQFAREYAQGKINLDPLSLSVRTVPGGDKKTTVTFSNIFGALRGVYVRYTLDGSPISGNSKTFTGTPVEVKPGARVRAALFVPGKSAPVLNTSFEVPAA